MEENQGVTSAFAEDRPRLSEQEQYKRLIAAELARQNLPLGHLADRIGLLRTRLHKIIRKTGLLTEDLRDQLFAELRAQDDPRLAGRPEVFEAEPYAGPQRGLYERWHREQVKP